MSNICPPVERVSQIVFLLRRVPPNRLPESLTAAALSGDILRMQLFLERGADLEQRSAGFASPLVAACSAGQLGAIGWLIERGAVLDPAGALISPIHAALGKGDCAAAALLLKAGLPIEQAAWGVAAAAVSGNLPMLRWLVARGVDLDRSYPRLGVLRDHALQAAEKSDQREVVAFLCGEITPGPRSSVPPTRTPAPNQAPAPADPAEREPLLQEALALLHAGGRAVTRWPARRSGGPANELLISYAAQAGVIEIVRALLDAGAKPDFALPGTPPPLYRAAEEAHGDIVRLLLTKGASPNGADGRSWLPLLGAVLSGEPAMVSLLLDAGARVRAKPAGGGTLAQNARGPYAAEIRALLDPPRAPKAGKATAGRKK